MSKFPSYHPTNNVQALNGNESTDPKQGKSLTDWLHPYLRCEHILKQWDVIIVHLRWFSKENWTLVLEYNCWLKFNAEILSAFSSGEADSEDIIFSVSSKAMPELHFHLLHCLLLVLVVTVQLSRQYLDWEITLHAWSRVCIHNRSITNLVIPFACVVVMHHCSADYLYLYECSNVGWVQNTQILIGRWFT